MELVGDLVSRSETGRRPAIRTDGRVYSHADLSTTAARAANCFSYLGATGGATVEIDPTPAPEAIISFLAAARLGAVSDFNPKGDGRLVVVPIDREGEFGDLDGTKRLVYGGQPHNARTFTWELDVWDDGRAGQAERGDPEDPVLATDAAPLRHRDLLTAAADVVGRHGLDEESGVALRAPLAEPGAVVAGVVAPLVAGGTILVDPRDDLGDVGVGVDVMEAEEIDPTGVL